MKKLDRVIDAVFNQPWAIQPESMDIIAAVIESRLADAESIQAIARTDLKNDAPQLQIVSGVPVIDIRGVISRRMNLFSQISGGTSIETLDSQFTEALAATGRAIVFNIDSPGGNVQGVPEFASRVFDAARNSDKTIVSFAETAASAAYWIGSQANELFVSEAGTLGSIGVIARIMDASRAEKNAGVDSVTVRSSELKAPGGDSITPRQMENIRGRVQEFYGMFKEAVSRARTGANINDVSTGETWIGKKAVEMRLADGVSTLEKVIARYGS